MPYSDAAKTPGSSVSVPVTTDTLVIAANNARLELTICNDSDTAIYLTLAATGAAAAKGVRLNANGGSWTTTQYRGAVSAFQSGAAPKVVTIAEV